MAFGNVNVDKIRESNLDAFMMQGNVLAQHNSLVCKYVTAATVDIDADAILLLNSTSGDGYKAETVNLTVDISTGTGANTLDTGAEATSTWYYLWVIYNPDTTTVAGLLSVSSTAPTMPSGYTYKGLVGAVYNGSGGAFADFHQIGHKVACANNNSLSGGTATTATSVSVLVPAVATRVYIYTSANDTDHNAVANVGSTAADLGRYQVAIRATGSTNAYVRSYGELMLVESQTIYYRVTSGDKLNITELGWEY